MIESALDLALNALEAKDYEVAWERFTDALLAWRIDPINNPKPSREVGQKICEMRRRERKKGSHLIGKTFGLWQVLSKVRDGNFKVKCRCGTERIVERSVLKRGRFRACRCPFRLDPELASRNHLFHRYIYMAKKRKLSFDLTIEQFCTLTKSNCFYCGCPPSQKCKVNRRSKPYIYNGIDRCNSSFGYALVNCVSACGACNRMKGVKSVAEFLEHCTRIAVLHKRIIQDVSRSKTSSLSQAGVAAKAFSATITPE
jgi:hypothetical protein